MNNRPPAPVAVVRRGFTLVEAGAVAACGAVALAMAPAVLQSANDRAMVAQSMANLRNLASANETYSGDWADRQFTACPDDLGSAQGDCARYLEKVACPPQFLLGWDAGGAIWGYFLGAGGRCAQHGFPGSCANWTVYLPMAFTGPGAGYGSFRLPGAKSFHDYVSGKYYDPAFYAPKDAAYRELSKRFTDASEFVSDGKPPIESSYCWSPAAMYGPKVFARKGEAFDGRGFTDPATLGDGYRSPSVSRCVYPTLKTRMIEHDWLQGAPPEATNPNFAGGKTPWFFNHGHESSPACLFFDGHIELVPCARVQKDETRGLKLWSRDTPLGADGYFGQAAYDALVATSFHVLTTDGIEGRDLLGPVEGAGDANAKPAQDAPAKAKPERRKALEKPLASPALSVEFKSK